MAHDEGTEDEKTDDDDESDELLRPRQMAYLLMTQTTSTVAAGVATMFCSTTAVSRKVQRVMQSEFRGYRQVVSGIASATAE